jgi:glycosyltransferase involved in cell wall biosynthesis
VPPLISVMIGVYNAAPYLAEAIDSVFAQSYRPLELIVVDDGSDDGSAEVARGYGDRVTYAYQENAGNGSARNHAVRLASGELFAFLDADDRFVTGKLDLQSAALAGDRELDMVFGHVREFLSPELTDADRAAIRPPAPGPSPWTAPNLMLIRRE